jgi:histidyl-tRNA synthetase
MRDVLPRTQAELRAVERAVRGVLANFGFEEWSLPLVEASELFQRSLGAGSDVVSKEMYTFDDRSGDSLTLRPEGTASLVRAVMGAGDAVSRTGRRPCRAFYAGPMFRYERPQKGRYRQFTQIGAELIGPSCAAADVEAICLGSEVLRSLGIAPSCGAEARASDGGSPTTLHLNTLGDGATRAAYGDALLAYFDEHAAALSAHSQARVAAAAGGEVRPDAVLRILDSKHPLDVAVARHAACPAVDAHLSAAARERFAEVEAALHALEIPYVRDAALVRGLDYYSHTVWEWRERASGQAVLAGGRYDGLAANLLARSGSKSKRGHGGGSGGDGAGAVGWALGLERIHALAAAHAPAALARSAAPTVVVVPIGDDAAVHRVASAVALRLRRDGAASAVQQFFDGGGSVKKQVQHATRVPDAAALVIVGEDELAAGGVGLKNLATREQVTVALDGRGLEDAVAAIVVEFE